LHPALEAVITQERMETHAGVVVALFLVELVGVVPEVLLGAGRLGSKPASLKAAL
jgi:hypothetical protein